jgi:hypothetical protein
MWVSGQRHAQAALYSRGKNAARYPLDRRLSGPQSWSKHWGYRKNPFPSAWDRTSIAPSPWTETILAELHRFTKYLSSKWLIAQATHQHSLIIFTNIIGWNTIKYLWTISDIHLNITFTTYILHTWLLHDLGCTITIHFSNVFKIQCRGES